MSFGAAFIGPDGPVMVIEQLPAHVHSWIVANTQLVVRDSPWMLRSISMEQDGPVDMTNLRATGVSMFLGGDGEMVQGPVVLLHSHGTVDADTELVDSKIGTSLTEWADGGWDVRTCESWGSEPFASWLPTSPWAQLW